MRYMNRRGPLAEGVGGPSCSVRDAESRNRRAKPGYKLIANNGPRATAPTSDEQSSAADAPGTPFEPIKPSDPSRWDNHMASSSTAKERGVAPVAAAIAPLLLAAAALIRDLHWPGWLEIVFVVSGILVLGFVAASAVRGLRRDQGGSRASLRPRLSKAPRRAAAGLSNRALGQLVGIVLAAFLGAFFVDNPELIPIIGSSSAHHSDAPHQQRTQQALAFTGTIIQPQGAWEYAEARLGRGVVHHDFAAAISVTGYCIGQATRNSAGAFDERWLILNDGRMLPYPLVSLPSVTIPLKACVSSPAGIGGPRSIKLGVQIGSRQLLLRAVSRQATTVGFALFTRSGERWQAVGLELERHGEFLVSTPPQDAAVALAVPCWAPKTPANPTRSSRLPLHAVQPLGQKLEPAYEHAIDSIGRGIREACTRSFYGTAGLSVRHPGGVASGSRSQHAAQTPVPAERPIEALKPNRGGNYEVPSGVKGEKASQGRGHSRSGEEGTGGSGDTYLQEYSPPS
jgi:hypothetical protein